MTNKLHVYKTEYESFIHRAYGDFSILLSVIAFLFWNIFSISLHMNWFLIMIIDFTLSFSFIRIPIKYIYYISSLTVSEESRTIIIELFKFDKLRKKDVYQIEKIDVKIIDHWFYRHPIYELRLYSNGKCVCKQRETSNWKVETFKEIRKITLELQKNLS